MPAAYPEEFRRRAVDLVRASDESVFAVARRLGTSGSGLRWWVAQAEIDEGQVPGLSTEEGEELTRLLNCGSTPQSEMQRRWRDTPNPQITAMLVQWLETTLTNCETRCGLLSETVVGLGTRLKELSVVGSDSACRPRSASWPPFR